MDDERARHVRDHVSRLARGTGRQSSVRQMILDAYRIGYFDGYDASTERKRKTTRELIDGIDSVVERLSGRIEGSNG
jgi:hypothetical protein